MIEIIFDKPYNFEGTEHKSINIDVDKLKGSDIIRIGELYKKTIKNPSSIKLLDERFAIMVAAEASGQSIEFFENLPASEFNSITAQVMGFLTGAG